MLTTTLVKSAAPGAILHDDKVRGLQLRVRDNGTRSFFLYFRTRAKAERRPKIGDWPVISLERAREIATSWLRVVAEGGDPVAGWDAEAAAPDVKALCKSYMQKHGGHKKTGGDDQRMIDSYILPALGSKKVAALTRADIETLHQSMRKTPYQANRVLALMSKMMSLAVVWGLRPDSPVNRIPRFKEHKRRRYMKPDEAVTFAKLLTKHGPSSPEQAAFLWLLAYTGARPSEIAAVKAEQRQGNRLELTAHKTDRTGKIRVIFLPPQAVEVLDKLGRKAGPLIGIKSPRNLWDRIVEEAGFTNLRMYDLRHSFASAGIAAGLTLGEIGELMGHESTQTTARYAHLMEELGVSTATRAADVLETMMRGPGKASAEAGSAARPETTSSPRPTPQAPVEPEDSPLS
jgi:integrase